MRLASNRHAQHPGNLRYTSRFSCTVPFSFAFSERFIDMRCGILMSLSGSVPFSGFFDQLISTISPSPSNVTPFKKLERDFV